MVKRLAMFPIPLEWVIVIIGFWLALGVIWQQPLITPEAAPSYSCLFGNGSSAVDICLPKP